MSSTLVDSNVLIDLFDEASEWRDWSDAMLTRRGGRIVAPLPDFYIGADATPGGIATTSRSCG